ncbi:MAG: hypothetical protein SGPRY_009599 [Prymnesium sp.]
MASVAIIAMDTRLPELPLWARDSCHTIPSGKARPTDLLSLTHFLNLQYARSQQYDLLFYRNTREQGCTHSRWGERHPSYCKLAGLADALHRGYEWVVYVDSDAFLANTTLPLRELLAQYGAEKGRSQQAFFGWDWPYTLGPNMGFIALRNTPQVHQMLRTWWNLFAGPYDLQHPMEQHTMQWQ